MSKNSSRPAVSVVVPAYNEEERLAGSLPRIGAYLAERGFDAEIVVVDDGSGDGTGEVARRFFAESPVPGRVVRHEPNRGKGYAVRHGFEESRGRVLLFTDADLSTPIEEFDRLFEALEDGADIAIGSRALGGSKVEVHQPWYRERMGKMFNFLVRVVAVKGIHDTQCGFKAFREEAVRPMLPHLLVDGWAFDVEILFLAQKRGLSIREVPVRWRNDAKTRLNAVSDSLRMFRELLGIRWQWLKGRYRGYLSGGRRGG